MMETRAAAPPSQSSPHYWRHAPPRPHGCDSLLVWSFLTGSAGSSWTLHRAATPTPSTNDQSALSGSREPGREPPAPSGGRSEHGNIQTFRHADRQTNKHTYTRTYRQTNRQADRHADTQTRAGSSTLPSSLISPLAASDAAIMHADGVVVVCRRHGDYQSASVRNLATMASPHPRGPPRRHPNPPHVPDHRHPRPLLAGAGSAANANMGTSGLV